MTRLWLIRHGPTHAKGMVGWTDLPADLSDTAQIARLRAALPDAPVVSSDLLRAVQTGDVLTPVSRLPHDSQLREINFGDWENLTFSQVELGAPDHIRAYYEIPGDIAPPNGESWNAVCARVNAAMDGYVARGHADLIVVAHYGVVLSQVQRALKITPYAAFAQRIENLSLTQITVENGDWRAEIINHNP